MLETNGEFWFLGEDHYKFEGIFILRDSSSKILLVDKDNILESKFSKEGVSDVIRKDVILGRLNWIYVEGKKIKTPFNNNNVTLIGNYLVRDHYLEYRVNYEYKIYEVVPYVIIFGAHFNTLKDIGFNKLFLTYDFLQGWVYPTIQKADLGKIKLGEIKISDVNIKLIVEILDKVEDEVEFNAFFEIEFDSEKKLKDCLDVEWEIRQFLNFISPREVSIINFEGFSSKCDVDIYVNGITHFTQNQEEGSGDRIVFPGYFLYSFLFDFNVIKDDFAKIFKKWFEIRENEGMRLIIDTHILTEHFTDIPQVSFLLNVFALEGYHLYKEFGESIFEDNNEWEELKKRLSELIEESGIDKSKKESLKNKSEYLDRKSLRRKIRKILLEYLGSNFRKEVLELKNREEVDKFVKEVVNTRNNLVHRLESPETEKLSEILPKIKAILKACILKELGFDEKRIIEILKMYLNSQPQYFDMLLDP